MINQIILNGVIYYRLTNGDWYMADPDSADLEILANGKTFVRLESLHLQGITYCNDKFWPNLAKAIIVVFIICWLIGNCL